MELNRPLALPERPLAERPLPDPERPDPLPDPLLRFIIGEAMAPAMSREPSNFIIL